MARCATISSLITLFSEASYQDIYLFRHVFLKASCQQNFMTYIIATFTVKNY